MWFSILILSLSGIIVLSAGFYQALTVTELATGTKSAPPAHHETDTNPTVASAKPSNSTNLLIIGDSIARGAGDETGKGLSSYLPEYLKNQTPKEIVVHNVGIDGLQSSGFLELLQSGQLNPALVDSDLILLSIGGNDLRRIRRLKDIVTDGAFRETFERYVTSLTSIITLIRKENAHALIIFIGLYNPLAKESSPEDTGLLLTWNEGTQKIIEEEKKAIFIPTYDLFKLNTAKYVARDVLHPNAAGYQAIANRIGKSIEGYFTGGALSEK